jgi:DNA-binding transcriptional MerR regulator
MDGMHEWLTTKQVAEHYHTPVGTIRHWRHKGYGPKGVKVGNRVLYPREQIEAFDRELKARADSGR